MIEGISKTKAALYARLKNKKMRDSLHLFVIEGEKSVLDSLDVFEVEAVVASEKWLLAHRNSLPVDDSRFFSADRHSLDKISSLSTSPDVVAIMRIPDIAEDSGSLVDENGINLLLDGVQDPGNLGTIIRTAHWFGVTRLFLSSDCADVYNAKTVQSAMGSIGRVMTVRCDLGKLIETHPEIPVYGTLLEGADIYKAKLSIAAFIIMGNEGNGISAELRTYIGHPLLIPPYNPDEHGESLNVAVATAVTLSQFRSRE